MDTLFDLMPKEQAEALVRPIGSKICQSWNGGWCDWMTEVSEDGRGRLTNRSRANDVNDFAVYWAKHFADVPEVECDMELGFFKMYVKGGIVLRFKRLDRNGMARNVKTEQQKAYYRNLPVAGIRPGYTRLTAGYILNQAETDIADIRITCQRGQKDLLWWFSILSEPATTLLPVPVSPIITPETSVQIVPIIKAAKEGA